MPSRYQVIAIVCLVAATAADARAQGEDTNTTNADVGAMDGESDGEASAEPDATNADPNVTNDETDAEASVETDVESIADVDATNAETGVEAHTTTNVEPQASRGLDVEAHTTTNVEPQASCGLDGDEAHVLDDHDVPASVFVLFSPDWMPIVTLGYRAERLWWKGGPLPNAPEHHGPPSPLHGLTGSLLVPVLASGHPHSKVRLALGLGAGVDFAMRRGGFIARPRAYDPGVTPMPQPANQRIITIQVHAQLGLILRAAPRGRGFLGSLLWLPTSRNFRYAVTAYPSLRDRVRTLARARLTLGWVHDHLYFSVFTGFAQSGSGAEGPRLVERERILEAGLQLGSGW